MKESAAAPARAIRPYHGPDAAACSGVEILFHLSEKMKDLTRAPLDVESGSTMSKETPLCSNQRRCSSSKGSLTLRTKHPGPFHALRK